MSGIRRAIIAELAADKKTGMAAMAALSPEKQRMEKAMSKKSFPKDAAYTGAKAIVLKK